MNSLDTQYQELLRSILEYGVDKADRTGTGTRSIFGYTIRHKMSSGFPLLTSKRMAWKQIVTELLWFLRGDTSIKYLLDNDCHIWDGDLYKRYVKSFFVGELAKNYENNFDEYYFGILANQKLLGWPQDAPLSKEEFINKIKTEDEFAKRWGCLGPIYGKQWRSWDKNNCIYPNCICQGYEIENCQNKRESIDQIANLIRDLKTNPDSRRLMVNSWNCADLESMTLPPCHYGFQVYTRELSDDERQEIYEEKFAFTEIPEEKGWDYKYKVPTRAISLMFNMRSNDVPLGLPFNIASYGLLIEIIGKMVNMVPDELIISLGDAHIYKNQIDGVKEQMNRTPMKLPELIISDGVNFNGTIDEFLESCNKDSFKLDGYESHPPIKIPLSN